MISKNKEDKIYVRQMGEEKKSPIHATVIFVKKSTHSLQIDEHMHHCLETHLKALNGLFKLIYFFLFFGC